MDSASLPSEPPDIKIWFSSYKYESPDLNSLEDFDGSGGNVLEEECEGKFRGNETPRNADDVSMAANGLSVDKAYSKVDDLLDSSLSSDVPDLKNWFSSYVYESPLLEATDEFIISESEMKYDEVSRAHEICKQSNGGERSFKEISELQPQSRMSLVPAKCTSLAKETNVDDKPVDKVDLDPTSSPINTLDSENVSGETLPVHQRHTSYKMVRTTETDKKGSDGGDAKPEHRTVRASYALPGKENSIGSAGIATSCPPSTIEMNDLVKDRQGKGYLRKITPSETFDSSVCELKSSEKCCPHIIPGKENEDPKSRDDGFVCVRKKIRRENAKSAITNIQLKSQGNDSIFTVKQKEDRVTRKVLSEKSNFCSSNAMETKGKWRCPQKNKPDIRPPLKQLRLEQWVRKMM